MLVGGAVALVVGNIDILTAALRLATARLRAAAPAVRVAGAYLQAGRFKALTTMAVTALVMFLAALILTVDGSVAAAGLDASASGGFQLSAQAALGSPAAHPASPATVSPEQITADLSALHGTLASAASLTVVPGSAVKAVTADLPGGKPQALADQLTGIDAGFAETNTLNLTARAAGYPDARTIWTAVEHGAATGRPQPAVWRFEPGIGGINPNASGFAPFTVTVTTADGAAHRLLVIGIAAATSHWPALFTGPGALSAIAPHGRNQQILFRLAPGASASAAVTALAARLGPQGLQVASLVSDQAAGAASTTAVLLTGYLLLGLLFGALALGVITSRSVLERRAHLGVLRAVGLGLKGLLAALLTEIGLQVIISLVLGVALALWSARRILATLSPTHSTPWASIAAMGAGCVVLTIAAVALPTRRAAATSPAEATRSL